MQGRGLAHCADSKLPAAVPANCGLTTITESENHCLSNVCDNEVGARPFEFVLRVPTGSSEACKGETRKRKEERCESQSSTMPSMPHKLGATRARSLAASGNASRWRSQVRSGSEGGVRTN